MGLYNIIKLQQVQDVGGLVTYANDSTQGVFLGFFTVAIFFILLLSLKSQSDFAEAFIVSGFLTFLLASIFAFAGWINILYPLGYLALTAFAGLYMYSTR